MRARTVRTGDHPAQPQQDEKGEGNEGDEEEGDGHDDNMYVFFSRVIN